MKLIILLGCIVLVTVCNASLLFESPGAHLKQENLPKGDAKDIREAIFTQWVDHSPNSTGATFNQFVYINDEYYQPGGPVFVFVSAASDWYIYWLQNSHMTNIAAELGAVIYALEPRYIGQSYPTSDVSLENLEKYFNINQILADNVDFIRYLRSELINYDSDKFVLFGHGRGGTLATWIHQRYPGLADGVWAVSSPISTSFDFSEYYYGMRGTVAADFPAECEQTIIEAFTELETVVENEDIEKLRDVFIIESEIDLGNRQDVALLYRQLFELLFAPIEYGTPLTISLTCNALAPYEDYSSLDRLGYYYGSALNNHVYKYDELVSLLRNDSLEADTVLLHERQELYLRCSGWSLFKTSSELPEPFNERFPRDIFADICNDVFGISYDQVLENNDRINSENSINLSYSQNIYFTNAEFDPHRLIGVVQDVSSTVVATVIPKRGKLLDFTRYVYADAVSYELYEARDRALSLITSWTS